MMELIILVVVLSITIIFYKANMPILVLIAAMLGMVINLASLPSGIPFTPWVQLLFILVELTLLIDTSARLRG